MDKLSTKIIKSTAPELNLLKEQKKNWYNLLIDILFIISNKGFQKAIWLGGKFYKREGPFISFYDEIACQYFDDLRLNDKFKGEGIDYQRKNNFLSENEYKILNPFHKTYKAFTDSHPKLYDKFTEKDLNSPEWTEVVELAKITLEKLKANDRK